MCVVFCRCGISTRFSMRTFSTSKVQTGSPASSRNDESHRAASNSLPPGVSIRLCSETSAAVRIADALPDVVQHHRAAERRRQRGDEVRVIAARQRARQRARRVAAESVGDEPLLLRERTAALVRSAPSGSRARDPFAISRGDCVETTAPAVPAIYRSFCRTRRLQHHGRMSRERATRRRSRPPACRSRRTRARSLDQRELPRVPVGRRHERFRKRRRIDVEAKVHDQQPLVVRRRDVAVPQHEQFRRRAPHRRARSRPARGTPRRCVASPADLDAGAPTIRWRRRSSQFNLQRSNVCGSCGSRQAPLHVRRCEAWKLRDELRTSFLNGLRELGLVIGEVQERARRTEFLALEQHRRAGISSISAVIAR